MTAPTSPITRGHLALYRRWRAQTFGQIVGQDAVVTTLRNAVRLDRVAHAFLFVGPRGTGKTSTARILAKAVNCPRVAEGEPCDDCPACNAIREGRALDVVEMDAASNNKVDDMRELLPRVYTAPSDLRRKVFIVDEVQRIKEGWDVLLKTLEEPPDDVVFIFCTTDPSQIRPAVVSRLQRFAFRPLTVDEIAGKLRRILDAGGRTADVEAVQLIASLAAGGMRDAEAMLDQLLSAGDEHITASAVRDLLGLAEATAVDRFIEATATADASVGLQLLDDLEASGRDLAGFADQVVARLRRLLRARLAGRHDDTMAAITTSDLARVGRRFATLDPGRSTAGGFRFQLELALLHEVTDGRGAGARDSASTASAAIAGQPPSGVSTGRDPADGADRARPPAPEAGTARSGRPDIAARNGRADERTGRADDATVGARAEITPGPPLDTRIGSAAATRTGVPADTPAAARTRDRMPPGDTPTLTTMGPELETRPHVAAPVPSPDADRTPSAPAGIDQLRHGWGDVVRFVGANPAYRPLVDACRPVEVRDGVVVLGFPEDKAFLRDRAEQKRAVFEEAVRQVMGRPYGVRCVTANVEALSVPAADEPNVDLVEQARRVFGGDLADVAEIS